MLSDAGCNHELIAAGFLHDIIEDCGYTGDQLDQCRNNRNML
jgi:(p)ppGpp synthase/HD superfamily hydrolase